MGSAVFVLLFLGSSFAKGENQGKVRASPLIPSGVPLPGSWRTSRFLQADGKGNLFLLRGDTLDVYPINRGDIGKPQRLKAGVPSGEKVTGAALSRDGSLWALVAANRVICVQDGKLQSTPDIGWLVTSVAMLRDTPAAGVLPMSIGRKASLGRPPEPPLVLRLGNRSWETYIPGVAPKRSQDRDPINALFADHTLKLLGDERGRMWVAYPYTGRLRRFTPAGRIDTEVVLGNGVARHRGDEAELKKSLVTDLQKQGYRNPGAHAGVFTAQLAIRGWTLGPDGFLYMLLGDSLTGGGTALGRYNTVTGMVETTAVQVSPTGEVSMAAGRDGLYLATVEGAVEVWKLSWGTLEAAVWEELTDAKVGGQIRSARLTVQ